MRNRVKCIKCIKCKEVIESKFRHDFVSCKCGAVAVDGGKDYWRTVGDPKDYKRLEDKEK